MAPPKPMLRYLLPGLTTATIALSLTATFFSGNAFLNSWFNSWFNNSFNRTTIHHNNSDPSNPEGDEPIRSPGDRSETAPISVQVEPVITVEPTEVNVLPEITVNAAPSIDIDNGSEANPTTTVSPQIENNWPEFEVEQDWLQPQGAASQGPMVLLLPGANDPLGAWGRSSLAMVSNWDVHQQFISVLNALSQPVVSNPSETQGTVANDYHCPNPTITQGPSSVPEPRAVVGLGVMGLVLSGMVSLGKGRH